MKEKVRKIKLLLIFSAVFLFCFVDFLLADDQFFPQFSILDTDYNTGDNELVTTTITTTSATTTEQTSTTISISITSTTTNSTTDSETLTDNNTTSQTSPDAPYTIDTTTDQTNTTTFSTIHTASVSSNQENLTEEINIEEEQIETLQPESLPEELPQSPPTPLKQRKLEKEVKIDFLAPYSCRAKNFSIDISNKNQAIIEIELLGTKPQNSTLEIGNLPLGIDITFLNTANYTWNPLSNETTAVLQITNQPGSQKGNFNIVILYIDNSTQKSSICQINIVNL